MNTFENIVYPYTGLLLNHEKERSLSTLHKLWKHCVKLDPESHGQFGPIYMSSRIGRSRSNRKSAGISGATKQEKVTENDLAHEHRISF